MLKLALNHSDGSPFRILCLGAHCDDIEIGCGGTILKLLQEKKNVEVYWVVFSSDPRRAKEARTAANRFLKSARVKTMEAKSFRDTYFPFVGAEIKEQFSEIRSRFNPDLIFTHFRNDLHQDHRLISELTWNAFRDHCILEYEIPKYDGDLGSPNVFVHLTERLCKKKIDLIMQCFPSQHTKHWFTKDTFAATLRLRGIEANAETKFAEAFYCRKLAI